MGIEFEWRVSSQDGAWEVLAEHRRRPGPRWPWWVWVCLALALIAVGIAAYLWLRDRYQSAVELAQFQIQAVIDLEARAYARPDPSLFLEQQDREAVQWYADQVLRAQPDCAQRLDEEQARRAYCAAVLPVEVAAIDLRGDLAWVEVIEGTPPVRRARFYRRTGTGWAHTAPPAEFWGRNEKETYGTTSVTYSRRDLAHLHDTLSAIDAAATAVCETVYCPVSSRLQVRYSIDTPRYVRPYLDGDVEHYGSDTLTLSSPWLTGVPIEGSVDQVETVYWVTYALASRAMRAVRSRALSPFQQAMVTEYAWWHATGDASAAPVLSRILANHEEQALPDLFRDIRERDSLHWVVRFWLEAASDMQPELFFETLLGIERDALLAGRQETYTLLQDDRQPWWVEQQMVRYNRFQQENEKPALPAVKVRSVELSGGRARVLLESVSLSEAHLSADVFFVRRGTEWLHTSQVFGD